MKVAMLLKLVPQQEGSDSGVDRDELKHQLCAPPNTFSLIFNSINLNDPSGYRQYLYTH